MLKKRIIPCLDIKDGRTVKGINFVSLRDAGDPVVLAKKYVEQGADELVFLDITATVENRSAQLDMIAKIAAAINIPFTVGGGVQSVEDARKMITAGADKVGINSAAVKQPEVITAMANEFGSQCVVVAIDTKLVNNEWIVYVQGGRKETALKTLEWCKEAEQLGAGEILLTSMNNDGTKKGFALDITCEVAKSVNIPVIASGGAGTLKHFKEVFTTTRATGGLAASIFHFGEISIVDLKQYLNNSGVAIR